MCAAHDDRVRDGRCLGEPAAHSNQKRPTLVLRPHSLEQQTRRLNTARTKTRWIAASARERGRMHLSNETVSDPILVATAVASSMGRRRMRTFRVT